jgi:hypothetical protein
MYETIDRGGDAPTRPPLNPSLSPYLKAEASADVASGILRKGRAPPAIASPFESLITAATAPPPLGKNAASTLSHFQLFLIEESIIFSVYISS